MSNDDIDAMDATEMRTAIAKAKGAKLYPIVGHAGSYILAYDLAGFEATDCQVEASQVGFCGIPDWPNDIGAAMGLMEELGDGWEGEIAIKIKKHGGGPPDKTLCRITPYSPMEEPKCWEGIGNTPAIAICRAHLMYLMAAGKGGRGE